MNEKQEVPKTGTFVADQRGGNLSTYGAGSDRPAKLWREEKMITNLKRLLFEAVPYIEADIDYNSMAECGDYERARIGRRLG
jgi:hypothetical protein